MALNDYSLNQAVVNPLWDLIREYLPVAVSGGRRPYRLETAEALPLAQRLLGLPEGERPYPLLRTLRGIGGLGIRNVVLIQVEGLGATLLERDEPQGPVMPFLRSLAAEGLYFPRVYQSFPSTDGAVFATLTSLHWTHALGGSGVRLSQSVMGPYFASLPRLLTAPGTRHYAFSGFRHRTAEITSFQRNLGFRATGFDALEAPIARARARWSTLPDRPASEVDVLPTIATLLDGDRAYAGMGRSLFEPPVTAGIISGDIKETFYFKDGFALRYRLSAGQAELLATDGDAMPPADLAREHPEVASRLAREFLALYETSDRLMRENRIFPIKPGAARAP
jgi:hypothetical protein